MPITTGSAPKAIKPAGIKKRRQKPNAKKKPKKEKAPTFSIMKKMKEL